MFSPSAIGEMLDRHLPDCAAGDLRVGSCVPYHARYSVNRRCLVQYEVTFEDTAGAEAITTLAHAIVQPRPRVERLWARVVPHELAARAAGWHPARPHARAALLTGPEAVVQLYPVDAGLPGLAAASSPRAVAPRFAGLPAPWTGAEDGAVQVELVRYKAARRAVFRYGMGAGEGRAAYGKLRADEAGAHLLEVGAELARTGAAVAAPLAYVPDLRMVVYAAGAGTRLKDLRGSAAFEAWMEPLAATLADLHATELPALRPYPMAHDVADLLASARTIAALLPQLADRVVRLAERVVALLPATPRRLASIHGSFHDDQVLVGPSGVVLVDFDSAGLGDPLLDVGHFASYLSAAGADDARARFFDAYARLAPDDCHDAVLYEAAYLLRWAMMPFRDLQPDWPEAVARNVHRAAQRLGEHGRGPR
jgi:hypothetical protein